MSDIGNKNNDDAVVNSIDNRSISSTAPLQNDNTVTTTKNTLQETRESTTTIPDASGSVPGFAPGFAVTIPTAPTVPTVLTVPTIPTAPTTSIGHTSPNMNFTSVSSGKDKMSYNAFTMKELLHEMYVNLDDYIAVNKKISSQDIKECKVMMFLSLMKGGVGVGILMTHDIHKNSWNGPCAISISYASTATDFMCDKLKYLLLINNNRNYVEKIMSLASKQFLQLGNDIPISFHNNNSDNNDNEFRDNGLLLRLLNKEAADVVPISLERTIVTMNKKLNHQYYQRNIEEIDILNGNILPTLDNDYYLLCRMLNDYIGAKWGNDDSSKKRHFEFDANIPLYQYYVFNEKELVTSYQQLLHLPTFPFANDIKKNNKDQPLKNLKPWNFGQKIYHSFQNLWHSNKNKHHTNMNDDNNSNVITKVDKTWHFDENVPLFQYYNKNNMINCDYKQLSSFPKFPFLHDIVSKHYSLQNYNPINVIKSYYKSYIKTNRRANAIYNYYYNYNESKNINQKSWIYNENMPLYQYYVVYNQNIPEMMHAIKYNKALLSKLPLFPFSKDIKIRKYSLFKYNPYYLGKKMYHQLSHKLIDTNDNNSNNDNNTNI